MTEQLIPITLPGVRPLSEIDSELQGRSDKAANIFSLAVEPILKKKAAELTAKDDDDLKGFIIACNSYVKESSEQRKPYFAYFDSIRSIFTTREKSIEDFKEKCEAMRNAYANHLNATAQEAERQRIAQIEKEKAIINIKANAELECRKHINEKIENSKLAYNALFNNQEDYHNGLNKLTNSLNAMKKTFENGFTLDMPVITASQWPTIPGSEVS